MPAIPLREHPAPLKLKIPQARVLKALADGDLLKPADMARAAGFTPQSGTLTRVLHGLREGSTSGAAHPGLLALEYIEKVEIDVDDLIEVRYRITDKGRDALEREGVVLPPLRDRGGSTNSRYK